ncbi:D-lactate ferricytochrome c oxidoreductase [Thelotrema lepadinum]|nr:D-lactate ferricytochrome c oxidoreductase [Thelotrema lepadinum]
MKLQAPRLLPRPRQLRRSPEALPRCLISSCRSFHGAQKHQEEQRDFRGQIYESAHRRVERERAEQRRFAELRGDNRNGRFASIGFVILASAGIGWYLATLRSGPSNLSSTAPLSSVQAPQHKIDKANLQAAWTDIATIVGKDNVSTDEADLDMHSGSEWSSYNAKSHERPFLIVQPSTTQEVSEIAKICYKRKIPMTAYSGGTSLEGHFTPTQGGVCIDFQRMGEILNIHKEDLDVIVQPAVGYQDLNEELAKIDLFFPPDPGPGAMIGGMVGTGCSGTNAYRYGTMKDWVLSLTMVMADGTIVTTRQRPRKSSAGYDLTRIFIGSEGTLGLVTEATLKVTPKPKNPSVAIATFPTIREAAECVFKVVGDGVPIAAVEILDDAQMQCINDSGATARRWKEAPTLFFKFAGTPSGVKEQIATVQRLAKATGSNGFDFAKSQDEADELWSARKESLWSVMAKRRDDGDHVWTTDVAVPISRLPSIIEQTKDDISSSGLFGTIVGHVGDGNFHAIILFNDKERKVAEDVVHRMVKRAVEMEGTVTGEHGVGLVKRDYLEHELGQSTVDLMRKLKQAFDPLCLLNCDKVVRSKVPKAGEIQPW